MTGSMNGSGRQPAPDCHGDVCITCSDTAVEVTVLRQLADGFAVVDTGAGAETVSIALVTAGPGDRVLVHAREAIAVIGRAGPAVTRPAVARPAEAGPETGEAAMTRSDQPGNASSREPSGGPPADMEALYPFLYAGPSDLSSVLDQVRASTVAKVAEIIELRQVIAARDGARLAACAAEAAAALAGGGRVFAFGNGGSATDAQELATLFLNPGGDARPLPALALGNDTSVITALCNDIGVEVMFARQIAAFGTKNDIAVGLSTSGNSENLLRAFGEASRRGMLTIGLAGYDGGKMAELDTIDYLFVAPSSSVHRIQEAQTTTYHVLWELTLAALRAREESR